MLAAIVGTQITALVGTAVLAAIDPNQIGQAVIGAIILAGYVAQRRVQKNTKAEQSKSIAEIHVLVNSRLSEALAEIRALKLRVDAKDAIISEQTAQAEKIATDVKLAALSMPGAGAIP